MTAMTENDLAALRPGQKIVICDLPDQDYFSWPKDLREGDVLTLGDPPYVRRGKHIVIHVTRAINWFGVPERGIIIQHCALMPQPVMDECICSDVNFRRYGCQCGHFEREQASKQ
jgi:hypothetical protein